MTDVGVVFKTNNSSIKTTGAIAISFVNKDYYEPPRAAQLACVASLGETGLGFDPKAECPG